MSTPYHPTTAGGRELYALLPTVYRARDTSGAMAHYLDALGALLDRLRATLEQRLADAFPASPPEALPAQSWLLPYFADLLDVRLVSPLVEGRRGEVANAIAWRQRKGTLAALEKIAETVGGFEVEAQEGWRRTAMTPRVDRPLLPPTAFGLPEELDPANPLVARRHPALPVVTVDVTFPSRAVVSPAIHPQSQESDFGGTTVVWRQWNPDGVPCFPGSFEDVSRRTPDTRTPGPSRGVFHPRRLLLFAPPPTGFFPPGPPLVEAPDEELSGDPEVVIEDRVFPGKFVCGSGRVVLRRVAAEMLAVKLKLGQELVIEAVDCLFDKVEAPGALVRLEGTTVMKSLRCLRLQASDCLFAGTVKIGEPLEPVEPQPPLEPQPPVGPQLPVVPGPLEPPTKDEPGLSCVRHSRVPTDLLRLPKSRLQRVATTTATPLFLAFGTCHEGAWSSLRAFGSPGYGVLDPAAPEALRTGAEDGGEMGADHHRATCLARAAVLAKLEEFLPLGIEAVLTLDPRLLVKPPAIEPPATAEPSRIVP